MFIASHPIHRRLLAEELVRLRRADEQRRYAAAQRRGRIDPNPHQIDAVVFALRRIPEGGCILADEVGLGKLARTIENAKRDKIAVEMKTLSSSNAGVAQMRYDDRDGRRFRIVIHDQLDEPSRYGVLCHELAHIYLGHLGANADGWWPARVNMPVRAVEFEAEAVAFVVTARIGLAGSSAEYLSRYFDGDVVPEGVSLDHIAKAAGLLERMAQQTLPSRPIKKPRGTRR